MPNILSHMISATATQALCPNIFRRSQSRLFKFTLLRFSKPYFTLSNLLALIPNFFGNNRRKVAFYVEIGIFVAVDYRLLLQMVVLIRLVIALITLIRRVVQNSANLCRFPAHLPRRIFSFKTNKFVDDSIKAQPFEIQIVDNSHRFRLFFVDYVRTAHSIVAENIPVAIQHAVIPANLLPCANALGRFSALFLRKRCHNRKTKFPVVIHRPNVIFDEIDFDTHFFELSCNDERIYRISCKTAHFTRYD